jgi:hypothetical protein
MLRQIDTGFLGWTRNTVSTANINFLNPELVIREITAQFLLLAALRHGFETAYSDEQGCSTLLDELK